MMQRFVVAAILLSIGAVWGLLLMVAVHNVFSFAGWYFVGLLLELLIVIAVMWVYVQLGLKVWHGYYGDSE